MSNKESIPYFFNSVNWKELIDQYQPAPTFFQDHYLLPPEKIRELQNQKLESCLAHAWSTDFYRRRWEECGVKDIKQVSNVDQHNELPSYVVDDLRQSIQSKPPFGTYQGVKFSDAEKIGPIRIHTSGGTTGQPRPTLYTVQDRQVGSLLRARAFYLAGFRPGDAVQNTLLYSTHNGPFIVDEALYDWLACIPVTTSAGIVTRSTRQIEIMRDWQVTGLVGFQDYLIQLARTAKEMGIDPKKDLHLKNISTMGGNPRLVEEEWGGINTLENYGMHETQVMAAECPVKNGMHLWEDAFIFDIVDLDTGESVPDGTIGSLVVTALYKTGVPVVRYDTKDTTRIISREKCDCGSSLPRIDFLQGRADTMVKLRGVNVWPEACGDVAKNDKRVSNEYFCYVERVNERDEMTLMVELKQEKNSDTDQTIKDNITDMLRSKLSVSINVEIYNPGELQEFTKFGIESKPRRFEDRRK